MSNHPQPSPLSRAGHATPVAGRATRRLRLLLAAIALLPLATHAEDNLRHKTTVLRYDIAMNGHTFHFQGPSNDAGYPADGTPFVIRGYLYPAGTFDAHGSSSGVLENGDAEFPNLVRGTWYCRGWHLQDGDAITGPVVATTQIFDLDVDEPGAHTVVSDGIELADFAVAFKRAIIGGTGRYRTSQGQQDQVYVDFNASGGFNTSTELRLLRD